MGTINGMLWVRIGFLILALGGADATHKLRYPSKRSKERGLISTGQAILYYLGSLKPGLGLQSLRYHRYFDLFYLWTVYSVMQTSIQQHYFQEGPARPDLCTCKFRVKTTAALRLKRTSGCHGRGRRLSK